MAHDHMDAANAAILETIWDLDDKYQGAWRDLVPDQSPLNLSDENAWRNFAGRVVKRFQDSITSCTCPGPAAFLDLQSKELLVFRDRLRGSVTCN